MKSLNRQYLRRIDYLRAIAAWWVLAYHAVIILPTLGAEHTMWAGSWNPFLVVASQGWLAVSLFVMVSGFSIALGLKGNRIVWRGFFAARWLRIAPLYLLMLFIGLLSIPQDASQLLAIFAAITLLPLPGSIVPSAALGTAWSVRIEFLLYFFVPALVYVLSRYSRRLLVIGAPLFAAFLVFALWQQGVSIIDILYWNFPGRLVEFAAGFAAGYFGFSAFSRGRRAVMLWLSIAGLGVVAFITNRAGGIFDVSDGLRVLVFVAVIGFGLLLLAWASSPEPGWENGGMTLLSRLGTWSYSTYLWHTLVIFTVAVPLSRLLIDAGVDARLSAAAGFVALVAGTGVVSYLSYTFIERPFLTQRPRYVFPLEDAPGSVAETKK